ncbi:MAG: hypothetical protein RLZZ385_2666 [Pseudomonadota bacterium]|jgi:hypothetical protein
MPGNDAMELELHYDSCMSVAHGLLLQGRGREALQWIGRGLQAHCGVEDKSTAGHPDLERLLAGWPALGVQLRVDSGRVEFEGLESPVSTRAAAAYFRHCLTHCSGPGSHATHCQGAGLWNRVRARLIKWLDSVIDRLWVTGDGVERHRLLHCLERLRLGLAGRAGIPLQVLGRLSLYLHEPAPVCRRLLRRHVLESRIIQRRRIRWRSLRELVCYREALEWPDAVLLKTWEQAGGNSLLIAAFHFGDYVSLPALVSAAGGEQRQRLLLLYEEPAIATRCNRLLEIQALGLAPSRVYLNHDCSPLELVSELRAGNRSLLLYCDVPRRHGRTIAVEFLGRFAHFSCAAAELALLARVPILALITYHDGRCNQVRIPLRLSAVRRTGESLEDAAGRLTGELAAVLETHLRRYPSQWHYLPALPGYFLPDNGIDALQP